MKRYTATDTAVLTMVPFFVMGMITFIATAASMSAEKACGFPGGSLSGGVIFYWIYTDFYKLPSNTSMLIASVGCSLGGWLACVIYVMTVMR